MKRSTLPIHNKLTSDEYIKYLSKLKEKILRDYEIAIMAQDPFALYEAKKKLKLILMYEAIEGLFAFFGTSGGNFYFKTDYSFHTKHQNGDIL